MGALSCGRKKTTTFMSPILLSWWQVLAGACLRYALFAGVTYLVFYVWKRRRWLHRKIQHAFPAHQILREEVLYSLSTTIIFAAVIYAVMFSSWREATRLYDHLGDYAWWYTVLSFPLMLLIHDTYFYWMHRLMHHRRIFRYVHQRHHRSHNPTPLAALSFHPIEALVEVAVLPLMVFTIPLHPYIVALFGVYMLAMNIIGHLGFELLPARFMDGPWSRVFNTSTHHNMHHHYGHGNYGLYFNLWDTIMRTNHQRYAATFRAVTTRSQGETPRDTSGS